MPSPFPGMDPFIEVDEWQEFHAGMIAQFHRQLAVAAAPKYLVRMERRIYLEHTFDDPTLRQPEFYDVAQYALALDYQETLRPLLRKADAAWARRLLTRVRKERN